MVLGKTARTTFVVLLALVMALVVAAPFFLQPVIVPLVGVLLIAPALLKLLAVVLQDRRHGEPGCSATPIFRSTRC